MKYIISATATWTEGGENVDGTNRGDEVVTKQLFMVFTALDADFARAQANIHLSTFRATLPKKKELSMSWRSESVVTDILLSKVISFTED